MQKQTKGPYSYSSPRYISFLTITLNTIRTSGIPLYSSEYSRRDYTQHQLLAILLLKTYIKAGYRDILDKIEAMDAIRSQMKLTRIPHHTTLYRFFTRFDSKSFHRVFRTVLSLFYRSRERIPVVAIDSTGFRTSHFSLYYSIRTGNVRKDFLKVSLAVDTNKKTILHFKISKSRHHDSAHAKHLLRGSYRIKRAQWYVMDRAYDAESIHQHVRQDLHASSLIPLRDWGADYVSGRYRSLMKTSFDQTLYHQRNLVETVFSVLKRRFGDEVRAFKYVNQVRELKLKCLVYSIDRFLKSQRIFLEG
jgi:hypothetical protein